MALLSHPAMQLQWPFLAAWQDGKFSRRLLHTLSLTEILLSTLLIGPAAAKNTPCSPNMWHTMYACIPHLAKYIPACLPNNSYKHESRSFFAQNSHGRLLSVAKAKESPNQGVASSWWINLLNWRENTLFTCTSLLAHVCVCMNS